MSLAFTFEKFADKEVSVETKPVYGQLGYVIGERGQLADTPANRNLIAEMEQAAEDWGRKLHFDVRTCNPMYTGIFPKGNILVAEVRKSPRDQKWRIHGFHLGLRRNSCF